MQDTRIERRPEPEEKPGPLEIPDVATEPHPTGPIGIPGLEVLPTSIPDDQQSGPTVLQPPSDDSDKSAGDSNS
jgi:hypothetical protein